MSRVRRVALDIIILGGALYVLAQAAATVLGTAQLWRAIVSWAHPPGTGM